MDGIDLDVRRHVYLSVVANGRPPTTTEAAVVFGTTEDEIATVYRRLRDAHALVLHASSIPGGDPDRWRSRRHCSNRSA